MGGGKPPASRDLPWVIFHPGFHHFTPPHSHPSHPNSAAGSDLEAMLLGTLKKYFQDKGEVVFVVFFFSCKKNVLGEFASWIFLIYFFITPPDQILVDFCLQ